MEPLPTIVLLSLESPYWNFNTIEGERRLLVYQQVLLSGLNVATRQPTYLAKVYDIRQIENKKKLERVIEAF